MLHAEAQHNALLPSSQILSVVPSFSEQRTQEKVWASKSGLLSHKDEQIWITSLSLGEIAYFQAFNFYKDSFIEQISE